MLISFNFSPARIKSSGKIKKEEEAELKIGKVKLFRIKLSVARQI